MTSGERERQETAKVASTASHLTIRPLRAADYDATRAIAHSLLAGAISPEDFAFHLEAACSLIAELDGVSAGYLLAHPIAYIDTTPLTLWVEGIVVHARYRRRGIARSLYEHFGVRAARLGATAILARIPPEHVPTRALHQQVGFVAHTGDTVIWRLASSET